MFQDLYNFRLSPEGLEELHRQGYYSEYFRNKMRLKKNKMLRIVIKNNEDQCDVRLVGIVGTETIEQFARMIDILLNIEHKEIVINCVDLVSINSQGLALLSKIVASEKINVKMINVRQNIRTLLDWSGLDQLISIH